MSIPPGDPDPLRQLARLEAQTHKWQRQSDELAAAMQRSTATAENERVQIAVRNGVIAQIRFASSTTDSSPVRLRSAVFAAYAQANARSNAAVANAVLPVAGPTAMAAVREALPPDAEEGDPEPTARVGQAPGALTEAELDEAFDRLDRLLSDPDLDAVTDSNDPARFLSDLGYADVPHFDSTDWQQDLDSAVTAAADRVSGMADNLHQLRAEYSTKIMRVEVGAGGVLLDFSLRPDAATLTPEALGTSFLLHYDEAFREAASRAEELLGDSIGEQFRPFPTPPERPAEPSID